MIFFDWKELCFLDDAINKIPTHAVKITEKTRNDILEGQSPDKTLSYDSSLQPILIKNAKRMED